MILGVGIDSCEIGRIERTLARFGDRFLQRVFTAAEASRARRRHRPASSLAKRWAAKEACSKALGTGVRMGVNWREMAVHNLATGQPALTLTGGAAARLASMTPAGHTARILVSLTDERDSAQAVVIIEAVPGEATA